MNRPMRKLSMAILAGSAFAAGMIWSGELRPADPGDLVAQAQAIVGRPRTPVSVAGVARRTTVRAVSTTSAANASAAAASSAAASAAAASAAAAAAAVPAGCVRVTDPNGVAYTRCP